MPIEFRCTHCQRLLRTADDTAGKQAKCPACGTLVPIPQPAPPPATFDSLTAIPPALPPAAATTQLPDLDELLKSSWRILRRQMGLCIAATLLAGAALFGFIFALSLPLFAAQAVGNRQAEPLITIYMIAWWLAANLLMSVFQAGQIAFFLKIVRGQPATIGDFFSGWRWQPAAFFVYMLVYLAIFLGMLLLIVPGIIVALMLSQALYPVVDLGAKPLEALRISRRLTSGQKLQLVVLFVMVWGLSILATLPCYLGLIIFYPWQAILWAIVYLRLSGQTIDDAPA